MPDGLQDEFELHGHFWVPQRPDEQVAGTVMRNAQSIELNLLGALPVQETDIVLGLTNAGDCTLTGTVNTQQTGLFTSLGSVERSAWLATQLLVGAAYDSVDGIVFTACEFEFDLLDRWLGDNPFDQTFEQEDGATLTTIRHRSGRPEVFALGHDGGELIMQPPPAPVRRTLWWAT